MKITRGKKPGAKKCVLYGVEGIGKSTFASRFPEPLFIDTEDSTKELDVARFDKPTSWTMLLEQVQYVMDHPEVCKTLVIDTIDWAERLCIRSVCARHQKSGIEAFDYGKGYTYVYEDVGKLLNLLTEVTDRNIHVVLTGHAATKRREQPDEFGTYDCWGLKLIDSPKCSVANMVKEWADLVLFANYKTLVIAADDKGKKHKAQGGKRVMYTTHHPCWDAKNRLGLPEELPLDYTPLARYFDAPPGEPPAEAPPAVKPENPTPAQPGQPTRDAEYVGNSSRPAETPKAEPAPLSDLSGVPAVLVPLMLNSGVTEKELRQAIVDEGYWTMDTPWEVMEGNGKEDNFVEGWLVPYWSYIAGKIMERRDVPF